RQQLCLGLGQYFLTCQGVGFCRSQIGTVDQRFLIAGHQVGLSHGRPGCTGQYNSEIDRAEHVLILRTGESSQAVKAKETRAAGQGQAQRGPQVDDLSPGDGSSMLSLHLDGVPDTWVSAEITPVEPEPVSTGVGIEMRTHCR